MRRPVAAYVGLRYLRTQRANQFASFVTIASAVGVALGVAALIVVLSVMNGFENELRLRLTSITGHAWVSAPGGLPDWRALREELRATSGIVDAVPVVELEAVLARGADLSAAVVTGTDPALEPADSPLRAGLRTGSLDALTPGSSNIILGDALAARIGARLGEPLTVLVPVQDRERGLQSRLRRFTVAGIFELGVKDHDGSRALVNLSDAAAIGGLEEGVVAGLRVTTDDIFAAPRIIRAWQAAHGSEVEVRDWTQDHATYFRAVRLEKTMMMVLLSLIVGVAAFNIVATLVMVVTDKRGSIAIMRTLGFSQGDIVRIFAVQGIAIGWIGVLAGVAAGIGLAREIDIVAPWLERLFGFQFMPADVYYVTRLPADLQWGDVLGVGAIALLMTALATIYPASRAAAVAPAEVLRYE